MEIGDDYYDPDNVPLYRDGVIYIDKKGVKTPVYIVQLVKIHGSSWAFVYGVDSKMAKKGIAKKRMTLEKRIDRKVNSDSELGNFINRHSNNKSIDVYKELPYIFQSLVVGGKSSFTGKEGDGFYEYADDRPTQLFIGIDDIEWTNDMQYKSEDLVKELLRSNEAELMDNIDGESI